jgi:hypothetical protein
MNNAVKQWREVFGGASSDYTLNVRVYSFFRTEDEKNDEREILGARSHAHPYAVIESTTEANIEHG